MADIQAPELEPKREAPSPREVGEERPEGVGQNARWGSDEEGREGQELEDRLRSSEGVTQNE